MFVLTEGWNIICSVQIPLLLMKLQFTLSTQEILCILLKSKLFILTQKIQTTPFNTAALSPILILLSHLLLIYPILAPSFRFSGRNIVIIAYFVCVPNCIKVSLFQIYETPASVAYHLFLPLLKRNFLIYPAQLY